VILGLGALGCGSSDSSSSSYASAQEVVNALKAQGECQDDKDSVPSSSFGPKPVEDIECTVQGADIELHTFVDAGARRNYESIGNNFGCQIAKEFGVQDFTYLAEGKWYLEADSETQAKAIGEMLGVDTHHTDC
jgi:hypothetical protein